MKKIFAIALILALLTGCTAAPPQQSETSATVSTTVSLRPGSSDTLTVHFLDVGQADSILLECGNCFALIDGGNTDDGPTVVEYLRKQGVEILSLVVGTHTHEDHMGGLGAVLQSFRVNNIWTSEITYKNACVYSFLNGAKAQEEELQYVKPGDKFYLGGATITVLGPVKSYEDVNNLSLVLMVEFGDTRFLFTGDMERDAEIDLLDSGANVKADVLKVGHHGSYTSTSYRFLREVAPTYGVISCGRNNEYGHPHDEPLSRLRDAEVIVYRTDRMYTVTAVSDGENIEFFWENEDALAPAA